MEVTAIYNVKLMVPSSLISINKYCKSFLKSKKMKIYKSISPIVGRSIDHIHIYLKQIANFLSGEQTYILISLLPKIVTKTVIKETLS